MTTIRNPVIPGFHPDPSICRVGDDFYLACSSFEYWPALPIFHSKDLVHWRQIGNAIDRPDQLDLSAVPSSLGITAPTLRHHEGRFWLAGTVFPGFGQFLLHADDPAGPWSDPISVAMPGIDPDLAWDEDGTCWYSFYGIKQATIDTATGAALTPASVQWSGSDDALSPEAPHLYRIGDRWYLMIAEGGTERGHAVAIARGPSPSGPFEPCPHNPILTHRGRRHPIQNTGHADLVALDDGTWWMVFLGVRPSGQTPMFHVLGRETFLTRVDWHDGWPVVQPAELELEGPSLPAHPWPVPSLRQTFGDGIPPEWLSVRRRGAREVAVEGGSLRLTGTGATMDDTLPVFLGRRQQHVECRVVARLDPSNGAAGLSVRIDERHHAEVVVDGDTVGAWARIGPLYQRLGEGVRRTPPAGPVELVVECRPATGWDAGPDVVRLGYLDSDGLVILGEMDGRYLSTEVAGGFTGRVIGVYATGSATVDWIEYRPEGR